MTTMTEEQINKAGGQLSKALGLKKSKLFKDRWVTTWGDKTNKGLYLSIREMMDRIDRGLNV